MYRATVFLWTVVLGISVGCNPADSQVENVQVDRDREAIVAMSDEHMRAVNQLDAELLLGTYTEDIVNLIASRAPLVGAAASRAYVNQIYAQADAAGTNMVRTIENIEIASNLAVEWGTISGEFDAQPVNLKYVWVWRRQPDGSWKTAYNSANENAAPWQSGGVPTGGLTRR